MPLGYRLISENKLKKLDEALQLLLHRFEENYEHVPLEKRAELKEEVDFIKRDVLHDFTGKEVTETKQKQRKIAMMHVQIAYPRHPDVCITVLDRIKLYLETSCGLTLNCQTLSSQHDTHKRDHSVPLIVLCLGKSRLGADVDETVAHIAGFVDKNTWIWIIHNRQEHALPFGPTDRVLIEEKYKQYAGIIDLAYQGDQGLYKCEMNDKSLAKICSIFMKAKT